MAKFVAVIVARRAQIEFLRQDQSTLKSDRNTPYHIEAFYRWQLTDKIAITPGFWVFINPEGDSRNDTQEVGHIRTSFNF